MSYSLNEVDAMIRKAARGSGLSWGLAEDLGHYARFACQMGLSIETCFVPLLQSPEALHLALIDAAELADGALDLTGHERVVDFPILWLCAARLFAKSHDASLLLTTSAIQLQVSPEGATLSGNTDTLVAQQVPIRIARVDHTESNIVPVAQETRADISKDALALLEELAMRTYAPETEASRLSGAGAGTHDND